MKRISKVWCSLLVIVMMGTLLIGCNNKESKIDDKTLDTSWYKEDKKEFVLQTSGQLYGFAQLSKEKSFEGKTIKLGADLTLNEVNDTIFEEWKKGQTIPERIWTPIGNEEVPFAGTFDGQGHTIKGLYLTTDVSGAGFFGHVATTAVVEDFRLTDSYIKSSTGKVGVIGIGPLARIENVYTDAYIEGHGHNIGGILGWYKGAYEDYEEGSKEKFAKGAMVINNCWFDGEIPCKGKYYAVGGIVGGQDARSKVDITNCLFTGMIRVEQATEYTRVGGIFGWLNWSASYTMKNCLSMGTIIAEKEDTVGSFIGDLGAGGLTMRYCYGVNKEPIGRNQRNLVVPATCEQTADNFKKSEITRFFPKLDGETETAWILSEDGIPVLKTFADIKK